MAQIKNEATQVLADDFIGAALILECLARSLRDTARIIRREGLLAWTVIEPDQLSPTQNQRMHKASDIARTCQQALELIDKVEIPQ